MLYALAMLLITRLMGMIGGSSLMQVLTPMVNIFFTFSYFLYFILFEGLWNGLTPGKKLIGIRVRMTDGTPITFAASLYRNLFRAADFLPILYLAGSVLCFLNPRSQRLGDLAAGTMVVHERLLPARFSPPPHAAGKHPFEEQVGDLRGMTMPEYHAIKRLCDRFPQFSTERQNILVRDIWVPFAEKYGIKPIDGVHPVYLMEAVVMRYARQHNLV